MNKHVLEQPTDWQLVRSETGPHIKLFQVRYDWMRNPRNGAEERMVILEGRDSANVIAITPEREVVLVRQYRFGIQDYTLELPGGLMETGESLQAAAMRELVEETGFTGTDWTYLGKVPSNPVFMNSYIHHWVLQDAHLTETPRLDDGEAVELVFMPAAQLRQALLDGQFQHPHTITALWTFLHKFGG